MKDRTVLYNVKQDRAKEDVFVLFIHGGIQFQSRKGDL